MRIPAIALPLAVAGVCVSAATIRAQSQPPASPHGSTPAVSLDGQWIAFVSDRNIFVAPASGGPARQVTHGSAPRSAPRWMRDGRLSSTETANGEARLYAVRPDGADERLIVTVPGRAPELSPDGTRVVYASGPYRQTDLFVANLDGSDRRQLVSSDVAWNVKWSPDGRRIALTGSAGDHLQVFVMNADGAARTQVTHLTPDEGAAQVPAWSADGSRLAFQANGPGTGTSHIWIVDLGRGAVVRLAPHEQAYVDEVPSWFPDGRRLAFQSNRTGQMEIWTMAADGTDPRQITGLTATAR
jgi:TolB protein